MNISRTWSNFICRFTVRTTFDLPIAVIGSGIIRLAVPTAFVPSES